MSGLKDDSTIELLDSENVGVTVEILLPSVRPIDPEMPLGVLYPPNYHIGM